MTDYLVYQGNTVKRYTSYLITSSIYNLAVSKSVVEPANLILKRYPGGDVEVLKNRTGKLGWLKVSDEEWLMFMLGQRPNEEDIK